MTSWLRRLLGQSVPSDISTLPSAAPDDDTRAPVAVECPDERPLAGVFDVANALHEAVVGHGLAATRDGDRVEVEDGRLVLTGAMYDRSSNPDRPVLMLEILAWSPSLGGPIIERFAGFGDDARQAAGQAFVKFLDTTFHVLIESVTSHACDGQVDRDRWSRSGTAWTVLSGPVTGQHVGQPALGAVYPDLFAELERLFAGSAASGPHWLSIFLAVVDGKVDSTEVMLDNKPWPDGVALVHAQRWPEDVRWETKRQFLIALPVD